MALVTYSVNRHIAFITLSSPGTGNTVNHENLGLMTHYIQTACGDDDIRALVLRGSGGVFCRGMDFNVLLTGEYADGFTLPYMEAVLSIRNSPKPVIAVVDGDVLAGGMGIVCASDIVIATEHARFGLSEVFFGLIPAYVFPLLLERVSFKKARYLAISSRKINPDQAHGIGLVDEVVPRDILEKTLKGYFQRILFGSPEAISLVKTYSDNLLEKDLESALHKARRQLETLLTDKNKREAIRAFQNGEPLPWSLSYRKSK
jgi:enoyl-CoA hydratase/carnithine racemase